MPFQIVYPELAADEFNYFTDWQEAIGDAQPGGGASLSSDAQSATLVGWVAWNKLRSCARFFLGFAYPDNADPWRLHRENPHPHPIFPQLRAASVSFAGVGADGQPGDPPWDTSPFFDELELRTARYQKAQVSVGYRNWRCRFLPDDDIVTAQEEWKRNTYFDPAPSVEVLSADGVSQLVFAEGGGGGPTAGTTKFPAPIGVQLNKCVYTLHWLNVPWDYVSNSSAVFRPAKLDACVGRVNSDLMFDGEFDPGTLLMHPYSVEFLSPPVASSDEHDPQRAVNVAIPFSFFDPPKGVGASAYRGHNLMPFRADGKFYYATRTGAVGGEPLIPAVAFASMFTHVLS